MINSGGLITEIKGLFDGSGIPYTEESEIQPKLNGLDPLINKRLYETTAIHGEITANHLKELLNLKTSNNYTLGFTTETNIPNRKNKRKRIQKKWIKRYGYKLKTVVMDGFRMNKTSDGDICTYEAVREI